MALNDECASTLAEKKLNSTSASAGPVPKNNYGHTQYSRRRQVPSRDPSSRITPCRIAPATIVCLFLDNSRERSRKTTLRASRNKKKEEKNITMAVASRLPKHQKCAQAHASPDETKRTSERKKRVKATVRFVPATREPITPFLRRRGVTSPNCDAFPRVATLSSSMRERRTLLALTNDVGTTTRHPTPAHTNTHARGRNLRSEISAQSLLRSSRASLAFGTCAREILPLRKREKKLGV